MEVKANEDNDLMFRKDLDPKKKKNYQTVEGESVNVEHGNNEEIQYITD